ncbi:hypothetical protein DPX16_8738 [Anabarilius grahami]|uniref:Uncharacterized protein n=1 Tax=Anabarilius grahami TaxID=495550 RepID=A0A3N0YDL6_ANAGA|nr:hypothetical protein DPX16_8738 [Anabarilius grahami]
MASSDAISSITERLMESKKQAAALQQFLPCQSQVSAAAGREQPKLSTSSSHRQQQKQSVATHTPPPKSWDAGQCSQAKSSRLKTDLRTVIAAKRALSKKILTPRVDPLQSQTAFNSLHGARVSSVSSGGHSANPAAMPGQCQGQRFPASHPRVVRAI